MRAAMTRWCCWAIAASISGCITIGNADKPIASVLVPAPTPADERTVVVVLPGFGSDAGDLQAHRIDQAVHEHWPEADVLMTSATFAYYKERNIVDRLRRDVIEPARAQGYEKIYLAGASIGGMGVVFYEYAYPGELDGLFLLAPWLGGSDVLEEIRDAGGIGRWQPGNEPDVVDSDNYERELWRVAKRWSEDPALSSRVWLICGTDDRLLQTSRLLAPALPSSHYLEVPDGAHDWKTFLTATGQIIRAMREDAASVVRDADEHPQEVPTTS